MKNKILVICGPTATGKSGLGFNIAKKLNGEIISADSRQVYKYMDIGTGKEYSEGVVIHGYDLVFPTEEFNVSAFMNFATKKIGEIIAGNSLPIIVGGTGFYIKGLIYGFSTINVPQNKNLRESLARKNSTELYEQLSEIDPIKAGNMNYSDRKNPRRLVRAIEVAQYLLDNPQKIGNKIKDGVFDVLQIGLTTSIDNLRLRIERRVDERVEMGMKKEVESLISKRGVDWSMQSMFSLGYRQYRDYFEGMVDESVVIDEWKREEIKYAKRQLTWFKKDKRINWFNLEDKDYAKKVDNMIQSWYEKS